MNKNKICFIYCVNNEELLNRSIKYVRSLHVPTGYEVVIESIRNSSSITFGYNLLMKKNDAKYKVYLHQDVFIINPNFIVDIINLFQKYPKLGMLGVAGAKTVSNTCGVWWLSPECYGQVYDSHRGKMQLLNFRPVTRDYERVKLIDGLIMITQYDVSWREDIFKGWHFYDASQSLEFIKQGYEVGVPYQVHPWCIHDCGIVNLNGFEEDRKIFLQHYKHWLDYVKK